MKVILKLCLYYLFLLFEGFFNEIFLFACTSVSVIHWALLFDFDALFSTLTISISDPEVSRSSYTLFFSTRCSISMFSSPKSSLIHINCQLFRKYIPFPATAPLKCKLQHRARRKTLHYLHYHPLLPTVAIKMNWILRLFRKRRVWNAECGV